MSSDNTHGDEPHDFEDEIVECVPIELKKGSNNLAIFQYLLRDKQFLPHWQGLSVQKQSLKARIKPTTGLIELQTPLDLGDYCSQSWRRQQQQQQAINGNKSGVSSGTSTLRRSGTAADSFPSVPATDNDNAADDGFSVKREFDGRQTLAGQISELPTEFAVGRFVDGTLQLTLVDKFAQLRPSFEHLHDTNNIDTILVSTTTSEAGSTVVSTQSAAYTTEMPQPRAVAVSAIRSQEPGSLATQSTTQLLRQRERESWEELNIIEDQRNYCHWTSKSTLHRQTGRKPRVLCNCRDELEAIDNDTKTGAMDSRCARCTSEYLCSVLKESEDGSSI